MSPGHKRALRELRRMAAMGPDDFEMVGDPIVDSSGKMVAIICIRIGLIPSTVDGLQLREKEEFVLKISPEFPFAVPSIEVKHRRFKGFPHVIWGRTLCLYQSASVEWNPRNGLFGFFDRLSSWLTKAAVNEMDPLEGPLEPPHHDTNFSGPPILIRANAPCVAGEQWTGLAVLQQYDNRIELVRWDDLSNGWPTEKPLGFAVILEKPISMEFPTDAAELFQGLTAAGMGENAILRNLALAAHLADEGQPLYLIVGLPMRRAADGTQKIHLAVWSLSAEIASSLRSLSDGSDNQPLATFSEERSRRLLEIFKGYPVSWCPILEDRPEIVVRRDNGTPFESTRDKKIAIIGCGALGSWSAEMVARAGAREIHLIDTGVVKPGLIARQNFTLADIGSRKVDALALRLHSILPPSSVYPYFKDAHRFVAEDPERFESFDLVIDCTASSIFQMKLERDWLTFTGNTPPIISMIIDGKATSFVCVVVQRGSKAGIWDSYLATKLRICRNGDTPDLITSFYSKKALEALFQPEPGCSDPTFVGAMSDVTFLAAKALNVALNGVASASCNRGWAGRFSNQSLTPILVEVDIPDYFETMSGSYRVRIAKEVFSKARSWILKSERERKREFETGGLLWGLWDDAIECIWITDLSGPPPDSVHSPSHFLCGVEGTSEDHSRRIAGTSGAEGFLGYWHTHPEMEPVQSGTDIHSMAALVAACGGNQNRAIMLIFGETAKEPSAGLYIYESQELGRAGGEMVRVGLSHFKLQEETK